MVVQPPGLLRVEQLKGFPNLRLLLLAQLRTGLLSDGSRGTADKIYNHAAALDCTRAVFKEQCQQESYA